MSSANPAAQKIRARLLLLEDNMELVANLFAYLEPRGFELDAAHDGSAGLAIALEGDYHLLIVNWEQPSRDGVDFVRELRDRDIDIPILMITTRTDVGDKVFAFRCGVDDYLTKPFALAELEVRIEALLTRSRGRRRNLHVADLFFDLDTQSVRRGSRQLKLTSSERKLLESLMRASPSVVSRRELEDVLWGNDVPQGDMLRSHMYELRRTIDGENDVKLVHTLRGMGYLLAKRDAKD